MWAEIPYSRDQCTSCQVAALRILPLIGTPGPMGILGQATTAIPEVARVVFWTSSDTEGGWRPRHTHLHGRTNLKQGSTGVAALKTDPVASGGQDDNPFSLALMAAAQFDQ
eukprot:CAMPEP_0181408304 /NCGR_PEP_ID=MMETSP1110-20121109/6229_1 /TAXON_ID=174948 /ORGANISM="Symbiodinium sp., Strain CCMP421" /LENGTH=110 /DNA_ID=CAMNT_0023530765 /DNA_START=180 /DNA_END=510 /DNA_ORIENTATION=+